jgi:hypothetical protein
MLKGLQSLQTLKPRKVLAQRGIYLEKENINDKFTWKKIPKLILSQFLTHKIEGLEISQSIEEKKIY